MSETQLDTKERSEMSTKKYVPTQWGKALDQIKLTRDDGSEYWSARDLASLLGYEKWITFRPVVEHVDQICGVTCPEDIYSTFKTVHIGQYSATRQIPDWHLSWYGVYIVATKCDPNKPAVAAALAYFDTLTAPGAHDEVLPVPDDEVLPAPHDEVRPVQAASTDIELATQQPQQSPFDGIRHTRDDGSEYWSARELMEPMGYSTWQHFAIPISRAISACQHQYAEWQDHFTRVVKEMEGGRWGKYTIDEYELSRVGAYLVSIYADLNKPQVADARVYFETLRMSVPHDEVQTVLVPSTELELATSQPQGSPFDAIRHVRDDGSEFWSARELMPKLGYDSWRRFNGSIDRAKDACTNAGNSALDHFAGAVKVGTTTGVAVNYAQDVELSRYACYLVAMNGDPRKPEIAAAQTYFAVQTRKAELAPTQPLPDLSTQPVDLSSPQGILALAENFVTAARALVEAEQTIKVMEPKAAYVDAFVDDGDLILLRNVAKTIGIREMTLRAMLCEHRWIYAEHGKAWNSSKHAYVITTRYSAYTTYRDYFRIVVAHNAPLFNGEVFHVLKATPRGAEAIVRNVPRWMAREQLVQIERGNAD